jgi:hypothetical protein
MLREDAEAVVIPHINMPSKGEPQDAIDAYKEVFAKDPKKDKFVEHYSTMHHGWMAAKANLDDPENEKEYIRG